MLQLPMRCVFDRTPGPCRVSENRSLELGLPPISLAGKVLAGGLLFSAIAE